jgi:hypothetical protein
MSFDDLVQWLDRYPLWVAGFMLIPPASCGLLRLIHKADCGGKTPWKFAYSVVIYWVCVPGLFAAMLTAYLLLFQNANLLKVNVLVFFLPVISMVATLLLVKSNVGNFDAIPGFGRLSGLMVMMGISFAIAFALHRLHFGILFFGDLGSLLVIATVAFGLLKWGLARLSGKGETTPGKMTSRE